MADQLQTIIMPPPYIRNLFGGGCLEPPSDIQEIVAAWLLAREYTDDSGWPLDEPSPAEEEDDRVQCA